MVDLNERQCKRMLHIFAKRAIIGQYFKERKYSERQIIQYLDRKIRDKSDWYLDAEEAIYYGFADCILGQKGFETFEKIRVGSKFKTKI
jgi:ATP-dependent protease ClpP protease subunit